MARALVLVGALASSGCITPEALTSMRAMKPEGLLQAEDVRTAVTTAQEYGTAVAAPLATVLAILCVLRSLQGGQGAQLLSTYLGGTVACAYVIASVNTPLGLDHWMRSLGEQLGTAFAPTRSPLLQFGASVQALATAVLNLQGLLGSGAQGGDPQRPLAATAVAAWNITPTGAMWLFLNGTAIYFMHLLLNIVHAWLLAFYLVLCPLLAPALILPATRPIFWGWMRAHLAVCLWQPLFGIAERITAAMPLGTFAGLVDVLRSSRNPVVLGEAITQAMQTLVLSNFVLFFVYLSVPVAAHLIVSGAGRPFRGVMG